MSDAMKIPTNCTTVLTPKTREENGKKVQVERCRASIVTNKISVRKMGGNFTVTLTPVQLAEGVNTREVHNYNVASGYLEETESSPDKLASESARTSLSRTRRMIKEYAACNMWEHFVTVTLSPEIWENRFNIESVQKSVSSMARTLRTESKRFKYLFIPEQHKNGAIHMHGLVMGLPESELIPYTMTDVNGPNKLPKYIVSAVKDGKPLYHCKMWDDIYGYNVVEPIRDLDRAASYISKYVGKSIGTLSAKTRYWHSRGLAVSVVIAEYKIPSYNTEKLKEYDEMMRNLAARNAKGEPLHYSGEIHTINGIDYPLPTTTIINSSTTDIDNILDTFDDQYARIYRR